MIARANDASKPRSLLCESVWPTVVEAGAVLVEAAELLPERELMKIIISQTREQVAVTDVGKPGGEGEDRIPRGSCCSCGGASVRNTHVPKARGDVLAKRSAPANRIAASSRKSSSSGPGVAFAAFLVRFFALVGRSGAPEFPSMEGAPTNADLELLAETAAPPVGLPTTETDPGVVTEGIQGA